MTPPRAAVITTSAIEIGCPACGEPLPSPETGSHIWTAEEFVAANGQRRTCDSCDAVFVIRHVNRVALV